MSEESLSAPTAETRQRLLDVALELFSRKGYAGTSVRELVEAAGVTKPVLYYYFSNKEGIYLALVGGAIAEFMKAAAELRQQPGHARDRVRNYCMELLEMFSNQISVARIIYSIYYGPPQGAPHVNFDESFSNMLKDIKLIIDTGIASRELAECDSEDMAWLAVSALNTAMEEHLCNPENPRIDGDKLGRMIDLLFRGITL